MENNSGADMITEIQRLNKAIWNHYMSIIDVREDALIDKIDAALDAEKTIAKGVKLWRKAYNLNKD